MILVTGVSGFIGKHLLKALIKEYGADQLLALTSQPIDDCPYLLHNNYTFNDDYFATSGYRSVHTIIHAGAFIPKAGKDANNKELCNSNINSTAKLLEANLPSLQKFVFLSTVDVYEGVGVISEESLVKPASLYGESKYCCEQMILRWAETRQLTIQILRVGHVYGPGEEKYQKIIPVSFKRIIEEKPVEIWGTGEEVRSFIYIDDVIKAIVQSLKLKEYADPVNIASSQSISIKKLINKLIEVTGKEINVELIPTTTAGRNLSFDNLKMKKLLLPAEIPLEQGLNTEWEYMKNLYA
jgi:nucleoside-diphosphate-sugar epimerase